jgi:hypothetical protein
MCWGLLDLNEKDDTSNCVFRFLSLPLVCWVELAVDVTRSADTIYGRQSTFSLDSFPILVAHGNGSTFLRVEDKTVLLDTVCYCILWSES